MASKMETKRTSIAVVLVRPARLAAEAAHAMAQATVTRAQRVLNKEHVPQ
jgi:hypothetical protein